MATSSMVTRKMAPRLVNRTYCVILLLMVVFVVGSGLLLWAHLHVLHSTDIKSTVAAIVQPGAVTTDPEVLQRLISLEIRVESLQSQGFWPSPAVTAATTHKTADLQVPVLATAPRTTSALLHSLRTEVRQLGQETLAVWPSQRRNRGRWGRRAAVVYQDAAGAISGQGSQLGWFLYNWHAIGLADAGQAFDVIVFVEPSASKLLPKECQPVTTPLLMDPALPGRCLWQPLSQVSDRDPLLVNNPYMTSLECFTNTNSSGFLHEYQVLLRTDTDAFLTPVILDWWPVSTQVRTDWFYANSRNVTDSLEAAAADCGLQHAGLTNLGPTWYGPADEIIPLATMTVAIGRYLHAKFFANSPCHGPREKRPAGDTCFGAWEFTWPDLYEGVTLLYAQDLALNHLWGRAGIEQVVAQRLDWHAQIATSETCLVAHLHVSHADTPFSKFAFQNGEYDNLDVRGLDLRQVQDYATYMAIMSQPDKGINRHTYSIRALQNMCLPAARHKKGLPVVLQARRPTLQQAMCLSHDVAPTFRTGPNLIPCWFFDVEPGAYDSKNPLAWSVDEHGLIRAGNNSELCLVADETRVNLRKCKFDDSSHRWEINMLSGQPAYQVSTIAQLQGSNKHCLTNIDDVRVKLEPCTEMDQRQLFDLMSVVTG